MRLIILYVLFSGTFLPKSEQITIHTVALAFNRPQTEVINPRAIFMYWEVPFHFGKDLLKELRRKFLFEFGFYLVYKTLSFALFL